MNLRLGPDADDLLRRTRVEGVPTRKAISVEFGNGDGIQTAACVSIEQRLPVPFFQNATGIGGCRGDRRRRGAASATGAIGKWLPSAASVDYEMGVAFFSPFSSESYVMPWRPIDGRSTDRRKAVAVVVGMP